MNGASLRHAAELVREADGLLITAGAGMGVDSGLPDFRGTEGFWRAYPALGRAGLRFESIASPHTFESDPSLAWGFYGHRLNLYRRTVPHEGFSILKRWADRKPLGAFVFTSNVDGQFQRAGFDGERIVEVHGSIHHLQCLEPCSDSLWSATGFEPRIDDENCRLLSPAPTCPRCGSVARPNILMFGDAGWIPTRTDAQMARLRAWMVPGQNIVAIELGAGTAIPSVRMFTERSGYRYVRINPTESTTGRSRVGIGLRGGALDTLLRLAAIVG
ncbi:MAG: NAD-dependent deacetylase [Burkholderiaceae bacterium]|nr:NAD-dependent deacetylase [Burkholderiaceae bacterium]